MKIKDGESVERAVLLLPHTHAGMDYLPGDVIDVTRDQMTWLSERGVVAMQPLLNED